MMPRSIEGKALPTIIDLTSSWQEDEANRQSLYKQKHFSNCATQREYSYKFIYLYCSKSYYYVS